MHLQNYPYFLRSFTKRKVKISRHLLLLNVASEIDSIEKLRNLLLVHKENEVIQRIQECKFGEIQNRYLMESRGLATKRGAPGTHSVYLTMKDNDDAKAVIDDYNKVKLGKNVLFIRYLEETEPQLLGYFQWKEGDIGSLYEPFEKFVKDLKEDTYYPIPECVEKVVENEIFGEIPDQVEVLRIPLGKVVERDPEMHEKVGRKVKIMNISSTWGFLKLISLRKGGFIPVPLPPYSLLFLNDEHRYLYKREFSIKNGEKEPIQILLFSKKANLSEECPCKLDIDICDVKRKSFYDSVEKLNPNEKEKIFVEDVYNEIADHWDHTRHTPWNHTIEFLNSLPDGACVADVGCGNGRNMGINTKLNMIGCDISEKLVDICKKKGFNAFVANGKDLPFKDNEFDHAISVAVLHHLASKENRLKCLHELKRIVKPGGTIFLCAWALEQDDTSRREFENTDEMVPWVLQTQYSSKKKSETYQRYCHLFVKGELTKLWNELKGVDVLTEYYDCSNWVTVVKVCHDDGENR